MMDNKEIFKNLEEVYKNYKGYVDLSNLSNDLNSSILLDSSRNINYPMSITLR